MDLLHINITQQESKAIYIPNDDSYLLIKSLKTILPLIPPLATVLEIGCGSGILIGHLAKWLQQTNNIPLMALGLDINFDACCVTQRFINDHLIYADCINSNGLKGINLKYGVDVFIFNPPYVPTEENEVQNCQKYFKEKQIVFQQAYEKELRGEELCQAVAAVNLIDCSYSGGVDGMLITWRILGDIIPLMNMNGIILLFLIADNPVKQVIQYMRDNGFNDELLERQQCYNEDQFVFKFTKIR